MGHIEIGGGCPDKIFTECAYTPHRGQWSLQFVYTNILGAQKDGFCKEWPFIRGLLVPDFCLGNMFMNIT